jgi:hypothetical protein
MPGTSRRLHRLTVSARAAQPGTPILESVALDHHSPIPTLTTVITTLHHPSRFLASPSQSLLTSRPAQTPLHRGCAVWASPVAVIV